jgi:hypothetical protein
MRSPEKRNNHLDRAITWTLAGIAVVITCSPGLGLAQQGEFGRFRNALIDYFKPQNYLPVIFNRGYSVGDVINVDGVDFYARSPRCFPKLTLPAPVSATLSDIVETGAADMSLGLKLWHILGAGADADLVRSIRIKFADVTSVSAALVDLREALDRRACPEIAPLVDGTITAVDRNQRPFFVVSDVVYGKREVQLELKASADLHAKTERIGHEIGDANLKMTASADGAVTLKSDVAVPIAVRPVTVPKVVLVNDFDLRGAESAELKWEPVDCGVGQTQSCAARFDEFAELVKTYAPKLDTEDLEQ